jgi:hypothetical protein
MALQRRANGGLRKNAGDLTPALAKRIVSAVRKTPLSLKSAAYACGLITQDLHYMIKRGSLPGADPLWEDTSRRVRELIAEAEAKNYARLCAAADGGTFEEVKVEIPNIQDTEGNLEASSVLGTTSRTVKLVPANVAAQKEIQRLVEKDSWNVDPKPEDAPLVYAALFSNPEALPAELQDALRQNADVLIRWLNALGDPTIAGQAIGRLEPATDGPPDEATS